MKGPRRCGPPSRGGDRQTQDMVSPPPTTPTTSWTLCWCYIVSNVSSSRRNPGLLPSGYLSKSPDHDRPPSRSQDDRVSSRLRLRRRIVFSGIFAWVPMVMGMAFDLAIWPHSSRCSHGSLRPTNWRSSPMIASAARSAPHPGRSVPRPRSSFVETAVRGDQRPRLASLAAVRLSLLPHH